MNITPAFPQGTTASVGKDCGNFGHNRQRDFVRCFAANIESSRREQAFDIRVKIERSIFAEPRQQLSVTFSWPEQSDVAELERQKTIERKKIATEVVIHDERSGLRIGPKIVRQF
jgi:hypothetical protein